MYGLSSPAVKAQSTNWQFDAVTHPDPVPGNNGDGSGKNYNPDYDSRYSTYSYSSSRPDLLAHSEMYGQTNQSTHCNFSWGYTCDFTWSGSGTPTQMQADITLDGNNSSSASYFSGVVYSDGASKLQATFTTQDGHTLTNFEAEHGYTGPGDDREFFPGATILVGNMGTQVPGQQYSLVCLVAATTTVAGTATNRTGGAVATGDAYADFKNLH